MRLSIGEFKVYIVKRSTEYFGTDLSTIDLFGRTQEGWLKKLDESACVVESIEISSLKYAIVLYSDTPLITYHTLENAAEFMEARGIENAVLPSGYIITENTNGLKNIDVNIEDYVRLIDAESYEKILSVMQERINREHMQSGVFIADSRSVYIDDTVEIGKGSIIKPNNSIKGMTAIGERVIFETNNNIVDTVIENDVKLTAVVSVSAEIGESTVIGPYVYLRPGAKIGKRCKVGDFVEIKNSTVADGSKVPHLAYVGDADVGSGVNVGCGVIFANYDGKFKHRTKVGNNSFIGSNTTLIAPIEVGQGVFIAAGATIANSIPDGAFVVARSRETIKEGRAEKYLKKD